MSDSRIRSTRLVTLGALTVVAAVSGAACVRQPVAAAAAPAPTSAANVPIAVNCGPGQQALIRPSLVNGQPISQVECVALTATTMAPVPVAPAAAAPVAYPVSYPVAAPQPAAADMEIVRPVYRQAARPAASRTTQYEPERRVVKSGRSWQKSALIIGSSAGIGAGVGGAVGGKKGALIGAAVGGGGATIWDQVTRRN